MPLPPSRRTCLVVAAMLTMPVGEIAQGATTLDCLPPIPPAPVTDAATRAEVSEEVNRVIRDYQSLGPEPDG